MKMPNCNMAVVDAAKLLDYCLNPAHPRGRYKARVFATSLGLTRANSDELRDALLNSACSDRAIQGELDGYGQRYVVDFLMSTACGSSRHSKRLDRSSRRRFPKTAELLCALR